MLLSDYVFYRCGYQVSGQILVISFEAIFGAYTFFFLIPSWNDELGLICANKEKP